MNNWGHWTEPWETAEVKRIGWGEKDMNETSQDVDF